MNLLLDFCFNGPLEVGTSPAQVWRAAATATLVEVEVKGVGRTPTRLIVRVGGSELVSVDVPAGATGATVACDAAVPAGAPLTVEAVEVGVDAADLRVLVWGENHQIPRPAPSVVLPSALAADLDDPTSGSE